jgi:hypothetical protein
MRVPWIALIVVFSGPPPVCHSQVAGRQAVENDVADSLARHFFLAQAFGFIYRHD